ncbi:zinc-dependent alcohol dehydrogenase [Lentibacillus amyloliquefaciens]|uniref:Enoyl reductase (ER) domain-containing protein n=1 Tax=Lentibacillus amyloliquefaciens TaxID=1472767 RepID=A0A0U3W316_9BACI|nr:alcohol dehydrogenase catalytic domain-containing protein [Lentibacillus amyloliquefaciens]ALX47570.1 hypothetical protein AOX59_02495 [Lentibacillus amyloliquefaciens]
MKALVYDGTKDLKLQEAPIPELQNDEVLIKVAYVGICGSDLVAWNGNYPRVTPPVTLGHEFSGVVEKVGSKVTKFNIGDPVVAEPLLSCGKCEACENGHYNQCGNLRLIGIDMDGGMADYVAVNEKQLFRIPSNVTLSAAALVEPLSVGVHMVKKSGVKPNQNVLIVGGGPIGLIAALVVRTYGANVYISEINPFRLEKAKELGFHTINPKEKSLEEQVVSLTDNKLFDLSFEVTGSLGGLNDCILSTKAGGIVVIAGVTQKSEVNIYEVIKRELNLVGTRVYTSDDYETALKLMEQKEFNAEDLITKQVSLENTQEEGFKAIEKGDPLVKVLINIENEV